MNFGVCIVILYPQKPSRGLISIFPYAGNLYVFSSDFPYASDLPDLSSHCFEIFLCVYTLSHSFSLMDDIPFRVLGFCGEPTLFMLLCYKIVSYHNIMLIYWTTFS